MFLQGNTAVYLLYAHARIAQILVKSGKDPAEIVRSGAPIVLTHDKEVCTAYCFFFFPFLLFFTFTYYLPFFYIHALHIRVWCMYVLLMYMHVLCM